ncbi:hypothetical protein RRG08_012448 [Elysia crispata]|uniref:Uncharacterized protein n=1 Tax=Elysia crispata TaxID=231223 RepID=A0AAE1EA19_9GAST|nr:hypothetical protein RRG08_012448 [Elysia crispata]
MASDGRSVVGLTAGETTVTVGAAYCPRPATQWPGWSSGRGGNCWWRLRQLKSTPSSGANQRTMSINWKRFNPPQRVLWWRALPSFRCLTWEDLRQQFLISPPCKVPAFIIVSKIRIVIWGNAEPIPPKCFDI